MKGKGYGILALCIIWVFLFYYSTGIHFTPHEDFSNLVFLYLSPIYLYISYQLLKIKRKEISSSRWKKKSKQEKYRFNAGIYAISLILCYGIVAPFLYFLPNIAAKYLQGEKAQRITIVESVSPYTRAKSCHGTEVVFKDLRKACFSGNHIFIKEGSKALVEGKNVLGGFLAIRYRF